MGRHRKPRQREDCIRCGSPIPPHRRSDALYCKESCRDAAEKARYCQRNPDYAARQRRQANEIHHMSKYGHIRFLDLPQENPLDKFGKARSLGYRSLLEVTHANQLEGWGLNPKELYEKVKLKYRVEEDRIYVPDLRLPNGIFVESKGRFTAQDRKKHLLVKAQYPELDLRFVFSNSNAKLSKGSKTTYAAWCEKNGFQYADRLIPEEWVKE